MDKKHIKIIIYLLLAVAAGFSGVFFDKYDIKQKIVDFRHSIYDYFTREPLKHYTKKDNENIFARFFSESDDSQNNGTKNTNQFNNIKEYAPRSTLGKITDYCHGFLAYGNPSFGVTSGLEESNIYICRDGYVVGYNYRTKEAAWVAYKLTKAKVANNQKRDDNFKDDTDVPFVYRADLSDYKNSGYDRGHLASFASMDFSQKSANQSFLLSNIEPQNAGLNRQGWEKLETDERIWANMYNSIYVYTGPIYKKGKIHKTIGDNKIAVPDYFFKIIYAPSEDKAIAFVMPNSPVSKTQIKKYRVSIKDIENRTGLYFLTNVDNRATIVNSVSSMWRTAYL